MAAKEPDNNEPTYFKDDDDAKLPEDPPHLGIDALDFISGRPMIPNAR